VHALSCAPVCVSQPASNVKGRTPTAGGRGRSGNTALDATPARRRQHSSQQQHALHQLQEQRLGPS
jgi:hypothetical protein